METGTLKELNVQPGDVVECLRRHDGKEYEGVNPHTVDNLRRAVDKDGRYFRCDAKATFRLVSRATPPQPAVDLTAITTPFGLLDDATQDALRAHGGPYEVFSAYDGKFSWNEHHCDDLGERPALAYRVKPAPKRETVTQDAPLYLHAQPGPVRTVTRKEIQTGTFGGIHIAKVYDDGVNISASTGKYAADDLRAVAATLTEIADALEAR